MSSQSSSTLKLASRLNREDFASHPIWEWVLDGESEAKSDESFARPTNGNVIPHKEFQRYLVSATAILKNGEEFPACVEVTVQGRHLRFNPQFVFLLDRQLDFVSNETDRLLSRYTRHLGNRPVKWKLLPLVEGERSPRKGRVVRSLLYLLASFAIAIFMRKLQNSNMAVRK